MKVMVTGSGGREHALAWRAAQSETVEEVFVVPGNAGMALDAKLTNVDLDVMDFAGQIAFAKQEGIALTIIGPEAPLVAGVVDLFNAEGLRCFGPSALAAQLEGSKSFSKDFLAKYKIPTAAYGSFVVAAEAIAYAKTMQTPIVIKADGLAAGKGVVIAQSYDDAENTIRDMLEANAFGDAGSRVVIEEFLEGEEASFIVLADGQNAIPFASSQDHKAAYDGDNGPNTGGMGAYSPAPVVTPEVHARVMAEVIEPTMAGMRAEGHAYTGFLYAGLMIDTAGNPKVIEFNCRFGDPETQPIMMRLQSDLVSLCQNAIDGELADTTIAFSDQTALAVVMAAKGYPNSYEKGVRIADIPAEDKQQKTFHAGTRIDESGVLVSNGGRVLGVTALGDSVAQAKDSVYRVVDQIRFEGAEYRTDIGYRAVAREQMLTDKS